MDDRSSALLGAPATGAEAEAARAVLASCLDSPAWVDAVLATGPHADAPGLLAAADAAARTLPDADVLAALRAHPRIGERPTGDGASAAFSRREQSAVGSDATAAQRLAAGNAAYEAR